MSRSMALDERQQEIVELALWFHDVIYVPGWTLNEHASANLFQVMAPALGVKEGTHVADQVRAAILATAHKGGTFRTKVSDTVVDIDLAILGAVAPAYSAYAAQVRQEYGYVSDEAWRIGRTIFLGSMLAREEIYQTPWGKELFESAARTNMARELASLEGR